MITHGYIKLLLKTKRNIKKMLIKIKEIVIVCFSFNNSFTYRHRFLSMCMLYSESNYLTTLHGNSSENNCCEKNLPNLNKKNYLLKSTCAEIYA